jgi:uncharacterized protein YdeI (YjbR/CyaY-like superfamily)
MYYIFSGKHFHKSSHDILRKNNLNLSFSKKAMELYFKTMLEWHLWLEENHKKTEGVWFVFYKKNSGKPSVSYNDAVEEALCFGWIDGKIKRVNEDYYIQWFTPRRKGSRWSKLNTSRVARLIKENRMKPAGLAAFEKTKDKPELIYEIKKDEIPSIPADLNEALKKNKTAYDNFLKSPPSSRRLYIFWLNDAKRPETRASRIEKIVDRSEKNIKAGMM